jgi:hypothetical protein
MPLRFLTALSNCLETDEKGWLAFFFNIRLGLWKFRYITAWGQSVYQYWIMFFRMAVHLFFYFILYETSRDGSNAHRFSSYLESMRTIEASFFLASQFYVVWKHCFLLMGESQQKKKFFFSAKPDRSNLFLWFRMLLWHHNSLIYPNLQLKINFQDTVQVLKILNDFCTSC